MEKCPFCGTDINEGAIICTGCQARKEVTTGLTAGLKTAGLWICLFSLAMMCGVDKHLKNWDLWYIIPTAVLIGLAILYRDKTFVEWKRRKV